MTVALLLPAYGAAAATWYVDGKYGSQSNPGTQGAPFLYFWQANNAASPGDTILLQPTVVYPNIAVTKSGNSSKSITITSAGSTQAQVSGGGSNFGFWINASYVNITNFNVTAPGSYAGIYVNSNQAHVYIASNYVHNSGGGGISVYAADYVWIVGNTVYGNAYYTSNGVFGSGISVKASINTDSYTGTKMVITGNVVYANTNEPNCASGNTSCLNSATDSDGNGIIIDDNRHTQSDNVRYNGAFYVGNNLVFWNGGRGLHIYQSDHVTANGNTFYQNNQDPYEGAYQPGEITGYYAADISVYNNILDSDGGEGIGNGKNTGNRVPISFRYCVNNEGSITVAYNLGYRPQNDPGNFASLDDNTVAINIGNTVWGNPLFENTSPSTGQPDLRVKHGSPAIGAGNSQYYGATDFLGQARTPPITIGAYQSPGP